MSTNYNLHNPLYHHPAPCAILYTPSNFSSSTPTIFLPLHPTVHPNSYPFSLPLTSRFLTKVDNLVSTSPIFVAYECDIAKAIVYGTRGIFTPTLLLLTSAMQTVIIMAPRIETERNIVVVESSYVCVLE